MKKGSIKYQLKIKKRLYNKLMLFGFKLIIGEVSTAGNGNEVKSGLTDPGS